GATMATDNNGVTIINFAPSMLAVGTSAVNTVQVLVDPNLVAGSYSAASDYAYPSGAVIPDAVASNNASTLAVAVVTPMPVQLTAFTAIAVGADARLNWRTAQEINNRHFEIERSLDGYRFSTIDTVFEATGRLVYQATYQPGQRTLPLDCLATGTYFVKAEASIGPVTRAVTSQAEYFRERASRQLDVSRSHSLASIGGQLSHRNSIESMGFGSSYLNQIVRARLAHLEVKSHHAHW
nr:hypothetical protein [Tanacetum cinerariifolium]